MSIQDEIIKLAIKQVEAHQEELFGLLMSSANSLINTVIDALSVAEVTTPQPPPPQPAAKQEPKQEPKPYNFGGIIPLEIWDR